MLYLLHGYSDDHTAWLRRSNMERYLHHSSYNMICVVTSMRNFFYTDMAYGYKYYTYMSEELPNIIESRSALLRTGRTGSSPGYRWADTAH